MEGCGYRCLMKRDVVWCLMHCRGYEMSPVSSMDGTEIQGIMRLGFICGRELHSSGLLTLIYCGHVGAGAERDMSSGSKVMARKGWNCALAG